MEQASRRWLQFGLRTLLLLMLAVSLGLGYLAHRGSQHRRLVAELNALGVEISIATPPALPHWVRTVVGDHLLGATYDVSVRGPLTDEHMQLLNQLPQIEKVMMSYSHSEALARVQGDIQTIQREMSSTAKFVLIKDDR